nr:PKD domain-containing protein [Desulfobulbaceae bacterium]
DVAGIGVGLSSFFAYKYDCSLMAWGKNNFGQLGIDTQETHKDPVPASMFSCLSSISADNHTVALDADGGLWTWGYNHEGQLGDGSTKSRPEPVHLNSLTNINAIDTDSHTLALKSDGSVWAWGRNNYGQLGDGTTTDQASPVQVVGLRQVSAVAAGAMFSVAVKSDGSVWAWGRNNYGQLGNGSQKNSSVPVQVLGFKGESFLNLNSADADNEIPPVHFTADPPKGQAPLKVTFKPVHHPDFAYKSVEWDFGDGEVSSQLDPVHIYETPGSYIVTLTTRYPDDIYRESMKQIVVKSSW